MADGAVEIVARRSTASRQRPARAPGSRRSPTDSVQPVPCVCRVVDPRAAQLERPLPSNSDVDDSGAVAGGRPSRVRRAGPSARIRRAASRMSSTRARSRIPASASASGMFGVTTRARGSSSRLIASHPILVEQPVAALRDHHGIDDDVRQIESRDRGGDRFDDRRGGEHADLRRRRRRCRRRPLRSAPSPDRRARLPAVTPSVFCAVTAVIARRAEDAVRRERLEVGLDAGAAARVAAGNCQCCAHTLRFAGL